jgi:hypothetical protein
MRTGQDPSGVIGASVHADFNFPHRHFETDGNLAFKSLRDDVSEQPWDVVVERAAPTDRGFVVEMPYTSVNPDGSTTYQRTMTVVTVEDGSITEFVHYCTGGM